MPAIPALTEVEFHTGLMDSLDFACRLLRKACRQGARVLVTAPPPVLAQLDQALWQIPERDFLPHVRMPGAAAAVARRTPIWLSSSAELRGAPKVLVNVGAAAPRDLSCFERVIEIVSADPDEAEGGRQRWRDYKAVGLQIKHHPKH